MHAKPYQTSPGVWLNDNDEGAKQMSCHLIVTSTDISFEIIKIEYVIHMVMVVSLVHIILFKTTIHCIFYNLNNHYRWEVLHQCVSDQ